MTAQQYISRHWKKKTIKMMAEESGFTEQQLRYACRLLDITPISERDMKEAVVLDNYQRMTQGEIAEKYNISLSTIIDICDHWGIKCITQHARQPTPEPGWKPPTSFWDRIAANGVEEWKREHMTDEI